MAQMTWNFSDIYTKVSEYLGTGSNPTGTNLTRAKDIVYRGYMSFLFPVRRDTGELHVWSFLQKHGTLVTKSGQWKYPLPYDYRELVGSIEFEEDQGYPAIEKRSLSDIRAWRAKVSNDSYPSACAVAWGRYDLEKGQTKEFWFYPTPNDSYVLKYPYIFDPPKPTATTDVFVGGPEESEVILQCCLAVAEFQEDETLGPQNTKAAEMLTQLMFKDEQVAPDTVGMIRDPGLISISPHAYRHFWIPSGSITAYTYDIN